MRSSRQQSSFPSQRPMPLPTGVCNARQSPAFRYVPQLGRAKRRNRVFAHGRFLHLQRQLSRSAMSMSGFLLKGFGCRPLCRCAGADRGAGVRNPRKEETAGRKSRGLAGASYGDLKVAAGSAIWRRGRDAASVGVGSEHDALFRGRGCERRLWARRLERVWGGREDIAFLLRRVVGDEDDRRCAAGSAAIVMRCRS
jgi:hypothetical protein